MRKKLADKEKKQKKIQDLIRKEQNQKLKKMQEASEMRKNKLRMKENDQKEHQNESKRQYIEHLKELKEKKEEKDRLEREAALNDYKKNQMKIASPIRSATGSLPKKHMAMDIKM